MEKSKIRIVDLSKIEAHEACIMCVNTGRLIESGGVCGTDGMIVSSAWGHGKCECCGTEGVVYHLGILKGLPAYPKVTFKAERIGGILVPTPKAN